MPLHTALQPLPCVHVHINSIRQAVLCPLFRRQSREAGVRCAAHGERQHRSGQGVGGLVLQRGGVPEHRVQWHCRGSGLRQVMVMDMVMTACVIMVVVMTAGSIVIVTVFVFVVRTAAGVIVFVMMVMTTRVLVVVVMVVVVVVVMTARAIVVMIVFVVMTVRAMTMLVIVPMVVVVVLVMVVVVVVVVVMVMATRIGPHLPLLPHNVHIGDAEVPLRQRVGLVRRHQLQARECVQRLSTRLHHDLPLRRAGDGADGGNRGGQHEGARARQDQDQQPAVQPCGRGLCEQERGDRHHRHGHAQDHGGVQPRKAVNDGGGGMHLRLGLGDGVLDLGHGRVGRRARCPERQVPVLQDRASIKGVALFLAQRRGLPRDGTLIHSRRPGHHHAIQWDLLPCADRQLRPDGHVLQLHH
mmetsp:Transcript_38833/g.64069  ORF Transcript_38833/g.64069 Transcript_38833/m.64069 type:complete len:412 (-) Transcript_38833:1211-2446(-)